jgi:hypothetical protein
MARMKKIALKEKYVQVPNETAKAVEAKALAPISLQALGLITNIWSYDVESWELYKSELYKRYAKNKETSVRSAWNELVEAKYIVEFNFRDSNGHFSNVYYYRIEPFTNEEIEAINEEMSHEINISAVLENPFPTNGNGKTGTANPVVSNTNENNKKESNTNYIINNPKPYTLSEQIENLALPMTIKKMVEGNREKILKLNLDLLEIERFYNTFEWIKPLATKDEIDYLNQWEFERIIYYIFKENIEVEKTTYGMLKQLVYTKLHFKRENALNG